MPYHVRFVEPGGHLLTTAEVEDMGEYYAGPVDLEALPPARRRLFDEYEALVNDQVFSLVDRVEGQIHALAVVAQFEGGCHVRVQDLQIFPRLGKVSFRVPQPHSRIAPSPAKAERDG